MKVDRVDHGQRAAIVQWSTLDDSVVPVPRSSAESGIAQLAVSWLLEFGVELSLLRRAALVTTQSLLVFVQ